MKGPQTDRGLRRAFYALMLTAAALITCGVLTGEIWLLGIGAWVLIGACLLEMIYRP